MKKVLVVHHTLQPPGGGSSVGAWTLEALRGRYDVTVLTWQPADLARVNRAFGTSLEAGEFRWHSVNPALRALVRAARLPLALFTMNVLFRKAKALARANRYHAVIGTINELDIGRRAIQYIHYPWAAFPRPDADYRWYHFSLPLRLYRWASAALSGYRKERIPLNVTLVNSDWTGRVFERYYGVPGRTLYPPVPAGFPDIRFEDRDDGFVCVGRISPEKELDKIIDILARVRARGHRVALHIVGHVDNPAYASRLRRTAAPHRGWIAFHHDLPRSELVALIARNRYGIHGMVGEHFGIAPAELQRAGCITFVPDDGGPVEIVGHDERVIYRSVEDAVEKIDRVLRDPGLRRALRRDVAARKDLLSERRFMAEIVDAVESFDG